MVIFLAIVTVLSMTTGFKVEGEPASRWFYVAFVMSELLTLGLAALTLLAWRWS